MRIPVTRDTGTCTMNNHINLAARIAVAVKIAATETLFEILLPLTMCRHRTFTPAPTWPHLFYTIRAVSTTASPTPNRHPLRTAETSTANMPSTHRSSPDYYAVLQIRPDASRAEISQIPSTKPKGLAHALCSADLHS